MTPDDLPPLSRRARRAPKGEDSTTDTSPTGATASHGASGGASAASAATPDGGILTLDESDVAEPGSPSSDTAPAVLDIPDSSVAAPREPAPAPAPADSGHVAFAWVDEGRVGEVVTPGDLSTAATPYVPVEPDLLADAPHRSPLRAGVIVPTLAIAGIVGAYAATTLLWPLHAVAPTVTAVQVQPVAAPAAAPAWPAEGSAAIAVDGMPGTPASSPDRDAIASITKVVTALVVLDAMPLAVGEQGPEFHFTGADNLRYWQYRANGESALDVPIGGSLSEYQMLEGMLIGSANNYADRLALNLWPNDEVFAAAADDWLSTHGVTGITIVEPTGMDERNAASAEALITLAQRALAHPVIAEIVAKKSVELPGAGLVENTNGLLADPGVVGIKTGTLADWNLLSAKDVMIGQTPVRMYASVLGQPDDGARLEASRALYAQIEQELQLQPSVTADTVAGRVDTLWGATADVITTGDASVALWNGAAGTVGTTFGLGAHRAADDVVGSLTVTGPIDSSTVELRLAGDIEDPSPWWRLTHPLDLFGLNG